MNSAGSIAAFAPLHQTADLNTITSTGRDAAQVTRQIESLFVQMLIKQMRQAGAEEGLFPGDNSDTYGVMFDQFVADQIADSKGIGLTTFIEAAESNVAKTASDTYNFLVR